MKRMILTGILTLAGAASGVMAQQPKGQPQRPPTKGPAPKSQGEVQALQALFGTQGQSNPDATIKAAEDVLTKYSDTEFKDVVLLFEAQAYQQKRDAAKAQIFAERTLEANPKNYQASLMLGELIVQQTRENDLDREEKLSSAEKYLNETIQNVKVAEKPNPQITDQQWDENRKFVTAEAHNALGLANLTRKKYDAAVTEFKTAIDGDPQPAYQVRLASAYQQMGKNDEAIALCDKLLADANLHPQIKQVAQGIKDAATKAKK